MTPKAKAPAAAPVFDALATAALELGLEEEEISCGRDDEYVLLMLERGGRDASIRIPVAGIPRSVRALRGIAENAARSCAMNLGVDLPRLPDPEPA